MARDRLRQLLVFANCRRKSGACECDALAIDSGVNDHAGAVQNRSVQELGIEHTSGLEPIRPVLSVVEMQQWKLQHVGRLADAIRPRKQLGTADREQLLGA